ncbi:radical SAM protein [Curvibacter sp. APW13]|uniref:radical SAM protein n=1 Tax=Curvibacter sp. APW13 TaxID=3077236 RepID=UPI0028DF5037|nr:radical SAM protein [Curvibacter sp. APW13]MDT8993017.1 radical SAM protein [Curvibacter sp. APW13]
MSASPLLSPTDSPIVPKVGKTLALQDKLTQRSVLERVRATDWSKSSPAPFVVEFDPTTACNLACPDCISRDLLNQGYFTRDRIRELTREMVSAGVKAVVLIGGGEPLAHPEIRWVINYLHEHGVKLGLTTNGTLMHKFMDVLPTKFDWIRVSMDAGTAETFQKIRPSASGKSLFDDVVDNMRALAKVKTGKLGYSFMLYAEGHFDRQSTQGRVVIPLQPAFNGRAPAQPYNNIDEIYQAAELAKEIGCDYFEIKPMYDEHHFLVLMNPSLSSRAQALSLQAKSLESDQFKVLMATKMKDYFAGVSDIEKKSYSRCAVAQLRTLVTPSGVYVCPYFRGRDDKRIGDVTETDFQSIWNGQQRKDVMNQLNPSHDCKMHCIRHDSNLFLESMIADGVKVLPTDDFDLFI